MKRNFVLAFLVLTLFAFDANAATLFGRVIEVNDGDVLTVFNLNRPVRIKLLAADAPESDQAFGEVAKKHLRELVFDKSVLVEYSGIAADGSLVGRVTLNGADIGAQMIRDGAAWFDASKQDRLSAADREIYQQSEQAARNEKRGLWQAENPVAPWEFVRAKTLKKEPVASLNSVAPAAAEPKRATSELTNLTLMTASMNTARTSEGVPTAAWTTPSARRPVAPDMAWAIDTSPKEWSLFKPAGENFSAEMPAGGQRLKEPISSNGGTVDLNVYMVRDGRAIYQTIWMTGPSYGEEDRTAVQQALDGFLRGVGEGYQSAGGGTLACQLGGEKKLPVAGYTGSEYELTSCTVSGKLRVFTRAIGDQRQMYVGAVFYWQEDPNVSRFIQSFTVSTSTTPRSRRAAR